MQALPVAGAAHSDVFITAALWTGVAALLLTALLGLQIIVMRMSLRRRERIDARALARWRPV
ncbi:MAG TPA: hypothetical protein DCX52_16730, partial [Massilia sp.]|nr:hypothetical protein [Massilia sp.]